MLGFLKKYQLMLCLLGVMALAFLGGDLFSLSAQQIFFTISSSIKAVLVFLLPFLIFPFIVNAMLSFKKGGALLVFLILIGTAVSMMCGIFYSYGIALLTFPHLALQNPLVSSPEDGLGVLMDLGLEPFFTIEATLLLGLLVGALLAYKPWPLCIKFMKGYYRASHLFFEKIFTPLLPLYIFGFMLKIQHDHNCGQIFHTFYQVFLLLMLATLSYVIFYFFLGNRFRLSAMLQTLRRCVPSWLSGFSSMSSVMTLPLTLQAAEENVKNKHIADLTIPTTVNCHVLGDAVGLSLIAFAIYFLNTGALPSMAALVPFAIMMTLAQFSAISIAGGSVIVLVPVLTKYLGFSSEMAGLATALAIFVDPWCTSCNVLGNGGYALVVDRFYQGFRKKPHTKLPF